MISTEGKASCVMHGEYLSEPGDCYDGSETLLMLIAHLRLLMKGEESAA